MIDLHRAVDARDQSKEVLMNRIVVPRSLSILALSVVLAACGQTSADQPSSDPVPSVPPVASPSEQPTEVPATPAVTPSPSERPSDQPGQVPATPIATPTPVVVEHEIPMIGRVNRDGVAVRTLPDLESGLVDGNDPDDRIVEKIRLRIGDEVLVVNGPIFADGYSWYEVVAGATGPAQYFRGFVAGEFLTRIAGEQGFNAVATVDGQGFHASASGWVHAYSPLVVFHGVTPMDGEASCTFELTIVDTAGERIEIVPEREVREAMIGQVAAPNVEALYMESEGYVTVDVMSDCSFAVMVNVPQG
jgi:hypothetical protein